MVFASAVSNLSYNRHNEIQWRIIFIASSNASRRLLFARRKLQIHKMKASILWCKWKLEINLREQAQSDAAISFSRTSAGSLGSLFWGRNTFFPPSFANYLYEYSKWNMNNLVRKMAKWIGWHAKMEMATNSKVTIQMQMLSFILIKCKMHIHLNGGTTERCCIGRCWMGAMEEERRKLGSENGIDKTIILNHKVRSTNHRKWRPSNEFFH